jgi:hypothetical protein
MINGRKKFLLERKPSENIRPFLILKIRYRGAQKLTQRLLSAKGGVAGKNGKYKICFSWTDATRNVSTLYCL